MALIYKYASQKLIRCKLDYSYYGSRVTKYWLEQLPLGQKSRNQDEMTNKSKLSLKNSVCSWNRRFEENVESDSGTPSPDLYSLDGSSYSPRPETVPASSSVGLRGSACPGRSTPVAGSCLCNFLRLVCYLKCSFRPNQNWVILLEVCHWK